MDIMFFLLLGHYLGDFAFQSDRMAQEKLVSLGTLTIHVLTYAVVLALALAVGLLTNGRPVLTATFALAVCVVLVEHWVQDWLKPRVLNRGKQGLFIDQALHLIVIYAVRLIAFPG